MTTKRISSSLIALSTTRRRSSTVMDAAQRTARSLSKSLFVLALAPIFATPAVAQVNYPLAPGTRWTYHLHQENGPGVSFGENTAKLAKGNVLDVTAVSVASPPEAVGAQRYTRVTTHVGDFLFLTEWFRIAPDGMFMGKTVNEDGQETVMSPPQKILNATLRAGETWTWRASDAPVSIAVRVVGPAEVIVPAGTYKTTQVLHETTIQAGPALVILVKQTRWLVSGVGYVKQETETRAGDRLLSHVSLALTKFEPVSAAR
jgi:hypothetical protein